MEKITILLIDDSVEDREMTTRALKKYKFVDSVIPFREGVEALDFLFEKDKNKDERKFILLDLNMPKMGGLEFIQRIKSDERTKNIPVAVLTSTTQLPDIKESMRMGVKYYIGKPIEKEDVEKIAYELGFCDEDMM